MDLVRRLFLLRSYKQRIFTTLQVQDRNFNILNLKIFQSTFRNYSYNFPAYGFSTTKVVKCLTGRMGQMSVRLRLHEQIKHTLFAQILPELLHTDR